MLEFALVVPPKEFAAWLKYQREARGWTLAEAAAVVGVHWNTWARWERGEMRPSALAQQAVRDALAKRDKEG
jgi:transcriptional regulator with XRE-family HTH domain